MEHVLGIDLGTTYSCVAYVDEHAKAVVLKNSEGMNTTPSVVMIESESNIVVGKIAKESVDVDSDKTIQFIKRKMGKSEDTVTVDNIVYHAPEISACILKKLVKDANEELHNQGVLKEGEMVKKVVITCPAYFGMNEKEATRSAGELAGLEVLDIINEPTAAAISYGISRSEQNETVLVYDLGGGTFDITVMDVKGGDITVICTGGDDQLGGADWDNAFRDFIAGRYEEEFGEDLSEDIEIYEALGISVEDWKKSLSQKEKVTVSVKGPAGRLREEVTRAKYDEITSELLNRTKNLLDKELKNAESKGYPLSKIDKVLLVGGSSRMPQVTAMLERDYNIKTLLADPDESVAKGAAIHATIRKNHSEFIKEEAARTGRSVEELKEENLLTGELDKKFALSSGGNIGSGLVVNITNVLSRTYGVVVQDSRTGKKYIANMLKVNDKLPATNTQSFYTAADNQGGVQYSIFESLSMEDTMDMDGKDPITVIPMEFKRPVPKGTEIVTTMALDHSGELHVMAEEKYSNTRLDIKFNLSNQMTKDEREVAEKRMRSANVE